MAKISINKAQLKDEFAKLSAKMMDKVGKGIQKEQMSQVHTAFREHGQPGQPWKRLWADTYQGPIASKDAERFQKATKALIKASPKTKAKAKERFDKAFAKLVPATSYRKGGEPLKDNGILAGSFFRHSVMVAAKKVVSLIASHIFYAIYHQVGYKTKGPNFIPLTIRARRVHVKGKNPEDEGLEKGVDYIMAWNGVTVPPRPMIDYANITNKELLRRAAIDAMKRK